MSSYQVTIHSRTSSADPGCVIGIFKPANYALPKILKILPIPSNYTKPLSETRGKSGKLHNLLLRVIRKTRMGIGLPAI